VAKTLEPVLARLGPEPTPEQLLDLKVCDPAMGSGAFLVEACRQLGEHLVRAWRRHDAVPAIPPDEDEELHARRLVAQRCLYGVDKNPLATDLAKLSLWLATLARDHPFTFLDHALRTGDSLVGLSRDQIAAFHWEPAKQRDYLSERLGLGVRRATEYRQEILAARDQVPYETLQRSLEGAEGNLQVVRLFADAVIAAFFAGANPRQRESSRLALAEKLERYLSREGKLEDGARVQEAVEELRSGARGIMPFHWQIEFPEVFSRSNAGWDCVVGNPPFLGGTRISSNLSAEYLAWLLQAHEGAHGNSDLVAHFFRKSFDLLREGGAFGLIATNTISEGDTRSTGLRPIVASGGTIYAANRRLRWPGLASVLVSVVNVSKRNPRLKVSPILDGGVVSSISAYLFPGVNSDDPEKLHSNRGVAFSGAKIYGQGFIVSQQEATDLIEDNFSNSLRLFHYAAGDDVNDDPLHMPYRYVINFGVMALEDARRWPALLSIVEERVKPERDKHTNNAIALRQKKYWWRYRSDTPRLAAAMQDLKRVFACTQTSTHRAFALLNSGMVYDQKLVVFARDDFAFFAVIQSRVHSQWAEFFGSSLGDAPVYTPGDCFETFPFPEDLAPKQRLERAGREYYGCRANLMVRNNEGLTKTYNRFHDPDERSPDILKLRELHAEMDRAVLVAYGWHDLAETATCEFLLDYEEDEDENEGGTRRRKKPWRYRWPDAFRDEVLARLLELNRQRAEEERLAGAAAEAAGGKKPGKRGKKRASGEGQGGLFEDGGE
jgi:hypothetical protein